MQIVLICRIIHNYNKQQRTQKTATELIPFLKADLNCDRCVYAVDDQPRNLSSSYMAKRFLSSPSSQNRHWGSPSLLQEKC